MDNKFDNMVIAQNLENNSNNNSFISKFNEKKNLHYGLLKKMNFFFISTQLLTLLYSSNKVFCLNVFIKKKTS